MRNWDSRIQDYNDWLINTNRTHSIGEGEEMKEITNKLEGICPLFAMAGKPDPECIQERCAWYVYVCFPFDTDGFHSCAIHAKAAVGDQVLQSLDSLWELLEKKGRKEED